MTQGQIECWEERNRIIRKVARSAKADLLCRYFDTTQAVGASKGIFLERFQLEVLNCTDTLLIENKSRQIGASFIHSADQLMDGLLKGNHTVIATSFNLEEAKEKVIYAKRWYDAQAQYPQLVPTWHEFNGAGQWIGDQGKRIKALPELVQANALQLTFSNGFRFISHPCRPPRGKQASLLLDEFAHLQDSKAIYTAAKPMITRGDGRNVIRIPSTPKGASGLFWEIFEDVKGDYKNFTRMSHGWWEIDALCRRKDYVACKSAWLAGVEHEELVRRFGTKHLRETLFNKSEVDMFLQEFCLVFLDSQYAFLSWDLIKSCHPYICIPNLDILKAGSDFIEDQDPDEVLKALENSYIAYKCKGKQKKLSDVFKCINALSARIQDGLVGTKLCASYDCGRHKDAAEISIFEITQGRICQRLIITLHDVEFDNQKAVIKAMFDNLPVARFIMDKGGLGEEIAEWARKKWGYGKVLPVQFDMEKKATWAVDLKRCMESRKVTLIPDDDQDQQLHSVQRKATIVGNITYVVEEKTSTIGGGAKIQHHADKFWAVAMAVSLADEMDRRGATFPTATGTRSQGTAKTATKIVNAGFKAVHVGKTNTLARRGFDKLSKGD